MQTRLQTTKYSRSDFENTRKWKEKFYGKTVCKYTKCSKKDAILQSGRIDHFAKAIKIIEKHIICIKSRKWEQYLWTWRQSVVPNDAPRDFGPEVAFGTKFQIPVARQRGREVSAPRPYVTNPFHPLGSINITSNFHIYIKVYRFFLPSGTDTSVLVWWVINNCACAFPKH